MDGAPGVADAAPATALGPAPADDALSDAACPSDGPPVDVLGAAGALDDDPGGVTGVEGADDAGGAEASDDVAGPSGASDPTEPAAEAVGPVPVALEDADPLPDTPAPTGAGAETLRAAPQSSQYSAPAGFSF